MEKTNLVEKIIDNIPDDYNDLEKAYYIYIETCKFFSYDIRYNNSPFLIRYMILHNKQNIKSIKDKEIICSVWSEIYANLLKQVGIKPRLIKRRGHYWVEFKASDMLIYCDPTYGIYTDLSRIKHNSQPCHFFAITEERIDDLPMRNTEINFEEVLNKLNAKIGYKVLEDEFLDRMKKEIKEYDNMNDKVNHILANIDLTRHDIVSDSSYLFNTLRVCLNIGSTKLIFTDLVKVTDDYHFDIIKVVSILDEGVYNYYAFSNIDEIRNVREDEVLKYADLGYEKNNNRDIGIEYPLKFKVPSSSLPYFLNKISFKNKVENKDRVIKR